MREIEEVSYEEICKSRVPGVTLFPDAKSFTVAERQCRKLKAVMTVIDSDDVMNATVQAFERYVVTFNCANLTNDSKVPF